MLLAAVNIVEYMNAVYVRYSLTVVCENFIHCSSSLVMFQGGQFDSKPFLLYYYYGGMIYLALKNYKRALFFFENVRILHFMLIL